jgi:predicted PurR-regulated permease PerM
MRDDLPRRETTWHTPSGALRKVRPLVLLAGAVLLLGILYWGRDVFIPLAIASLLAFVLTPGVSVLQRRGLPRSIAVLLVVVMGFSALAGIGWIVADQVLSLAQELPKYRYNIRQKAADLRDVGRSGWRTTSSARSSGASRRRIAASRRRSS